LIADLKRDIADDRRGWLKHGVTALAVSLLGLGVAGSVMLTGAAQSGTTTADPDTSQARISRADQPNRSSDRAPLDAAKVKSLADQRAEDLSKAGEQITDKSTDKASVKRAKALLAAQAAARKQAALLSNGRTATASSGTQAPATASTAPSGGKSCMPVTSGYRIAARFGQVGMWSRYHTGFDFSAPIGTALHAPAAGVVTNAGIGPASGWAGNYVAIKYPDGTQSLMAHMSTVSVRTGQTVSACQNVGAVGMTGRTFGPHVHFEIYPAGITPGDVYKAVNPVPWLEAHGLHP
jgi:murein DD-endopeptidase MepM/ murein hydrolase activator NlpD